MAEWGHGQYGMPGGHALAAEFDRMVADRYLKSSPDSEIGIRARLEYLLNREGGATALAAAGIPGKRGEAGVRQLVDWLSGAVHPRRATREKIDRAYREVRGRYVARWLKGQLRDARGGRGARVSVEPLPGTALPARSGDGRSHRRRQNQFGDKEFGIPPSRWADLVRAWDVGDLGGMDAMWVDLCDDILGSEGVGYYEVTHIGISF